MKYRNKADMALIAVLILFIPSIALKVVFKGNFWIELISFTLEASLIGSAADWFAVTALFRKPLGFSWHTAIIPRNRAKLTGSITTLVEQELLGPDEILKRLDTAEIMPLIKPAVTRASQREKIAGVLDSYLESRLSSINFGKVSEYLQDFIGEGLKKVDLSEGLPIWVEKSFGRESSGELVSNLLEKLIVYIKKDSTRKTIFKILRKSTLRSDSGSLLTRTFLSFVRRGEHINFVTLSEMIQDELAQTLTEALDSGSHGAGELAGRLEAVLLEQIKGLNTSEIIDEWKIRLSENLNIKAELNNALASAVNSPEIRKELTAWFSMELERYLVRLSSGDTEAVFENTFRNAVASLIRSEHHIIGEAVRETLEEFSDEKLTEFIEEKTGDDLQWIRINGTIVGGTVGIIVFLFLRFLYDPFAVPFVLGLFGLR